MDLNEYQRLAQVTRNKALVGDIRLATAALGLAGEVAELADETNLVDVVKELGDVCWYVAEIADNFDVKLANVIPGRSDKSMVVDAGLVVDAIKKIVGHGHPKDFETIRIKLGRVWGHVEKTCDAAGVSLSDVLEKNIAKLAARYPEGFATARSIHRES